MSTAGGFMYPGQTVGSLPTPLRSSNSLPSKIIRAKDTSRQLDVDLSLNLSTGEITFLGCSGSINNLVTDNFAYMNQVRELFYGLYYPAEDSSSPYTHTSTSGFTDTDLIMSLFKSYTNNLPSFGLAPMYRDIILIDSIFKGAKLYFESIRPTYANYDWASKETFRDDVMDAVVLVKKQNHMHIDSVIEASVQGLLELESVIPYVTETSDTLIDKLKAQCKTTKVYTCEPSTTLFNNVLVSLASSTQSQYYDTSTDRILINSNSLLRKRAFVALAQTVFLYLANTMPPSSNQLQAWIDFFDNTIKPNISDSTIDEFKGVFMSLSGNYTDDYEPMVYAFLVAKYSALSASSTSGSSAQDAVDTYNASIGSYVSNNPAEVANGRGATYGMYTALTHTYNNPAINIDSPIESIKQGGIQITMVVGEIDIVV